MNWTNRLSCVIGKVSDNEDSVSILFKKTDDSYQLPNFAWDTNQNCQDFLREKLNIALKTNAEIGNPFYVANTKNSCSIYFFATIVNSSQKTTPLIPDNFIWIPQSDLAKLPFLDSQDLTAINQAFFQLGYKDL